MPRSRPTALKWISWALGLFLCLLCVSPVPAQDDRPILDVTIEGGMAAIKIAVPPPMADAADDPNAGELILTLRDDLKFSGFFDIVDPSLYRLVPPAEGTEERHEDWLSIGAE